LYCAICNSAHNHLDHAFSILVALAQFKRWTKIRQGLQQMRRWHEYMHMYSTLCTCITAHAHAAHTRTHANPTTSAPEACAHSHQAHYTYMLDRRQQVQCGRRRAAHTRRALCAPSLRGGCSTRRQRHNDTQSIAGHMPLLARAAVHMGWAWIAERWSAREAERESGRQVLLTSSQTAGTTPSCGDC